MKSNYMKENLIERRTTYIPPSINNSNVNEVSLNIDNNPFKHYKSENETGAFVNFAMPDQKLNQSGISLSMSNRNNETNQVNTEPNVSNKLLVNYSKLEVKEKISKIFMAYSKYYKEEKIFLLSQQSLIKVLKKLNLIDEVHLKLSEIDILFRKINPHSNKFTEKQFLDFIVRLVGKMYPQEYAENPKNSLNNFISNTFEPFSKYLDDIYNKTQEKSDNNINNINPLKNIQNLVFKIFDKNVNTLLNSIYFAIKEIYLNYFHYENNNYKDKKKVHEESMKSLIEFFKDFEIFPYLINMDQVVTYYNLITKIDANSTENFLDYEKEDKEIGYYFTINKFCLMLYHLAIISYSKHTLFDKECRITDVDKVLLFLEKLENSKGFQNLERRTSKPHNSKITLIPPKSLITASESYIFSIEAKETIMQHSSSFNNEINTKIIKEFNEKVKKNEDVDLRSILCVEEDVYNIINNKIDSIKEVFSYYSKFGDKLNIDRMNLSSFFKFLKDCNLIVNNCKDPKEEKSNRFTHAKNSILLYSSKSSKSPLKSFNTNTIDCNSIVGKLTESEVNVIFTILTGIKNFDNSDKNSHKAINFDHSFLTALGNKKVATVPSKMDLFLFIKSFEVLSMKIYPGINLNKAVMQFLDKVS